MFLLSLRKKKISFISKKLRFLKTASIVFMKNVIFLIHFLFSLIFYLFQQFEKKCTLILMNFEILKLNYDIRTAEFFLFASRQINMRILIKIFFFFQILFFIHVFSLHVIVMNVMFIIILTEFSQ